MNPKKITKIILFIAVAYCASVGFGVYRITSSQVFPQAKKGLAAYLIASNSSEANKPTYLKWWSSWYFKDGLSDGRAQFSLCSVSEHCHTIIAYTVGGKWAINVDGYLVNTEKWLVDGEGRLVNAEIPPSENFGLTAPLQPRVPPQKPVNKSP